MQSAEHKVPDGKLLRADVATDSGEIRDVTLHGDFFVYPEQALDAVEAAVAGLPVDADADRIAGAVADAVPGDARLVGFGPGDVAAVVREAMQDG